MTNNAQTIRVSLTDAFHNKTNLTGKTSAYGHSFRTADVSLEQFANRILSGKTWAVSIYKDGHRKKEMFISSQILALDCDNSISVENALSNPFVRGYAFLVHPSPSSTPENPRTRIIFILTETVTDPDHWETMARGLLVYCADLRPDGSGKDAARMFHGSDVPGAYTKYYARLPIEVAGALTLPEASAEMERVLAIRDVPVAGEQKTKRGGKLSPELVAKVEHRLGVQGKPVGSSGFLNEAIACPIKPHEHNDEAPAAYWHPEKKLLYCHKCGKRYLTRQIAKALGVDVKKNYPAKRKHTPDFDPNDPAIIHFNERYVSKYPLGEILYPNGAVMIKSPMATGKTEATTQQVIDHPDARVLYVVHRRSLAKNVTNRLNAALHEAGVNLHFENYEGLKAQYLQQIPRLVICINSLFKLVRNGYPLPLFDLIILDEIEQQLGHLTGNTFEGNEAVTVYTIFREIVSRAGSVLALDAYATPLSLKWLRSIRGEDGVKVLVNDYLPITRKMTLWGDFALGIVEANKILESNSGLPIVFAVNSLSVAKLIYSFYSGKFDVSSEELQRIRDDKGASVAISIAGKFYDEQGLGSDAVAIIHGDNSQYKETQALIDHIDERLKGLRVLIYTSSLGSGVDIQTPVEAIFGVFNGGILPADELHQMLGRCRNVSDTHVYIQGGGGGLETDASVLFERESHAINETSKMFKRKSVASWDFDQNGVATINKHQAAFLRFWSHVKAKTNRSLNHLKEHFLELAEEKYDITRWDFQGLDGDEQTEELQDDLDKMDAVLLKVDKHLVLTSPPIDAATYQQLNDRGDGTPQIQGGYARWTIERGYRQAITSPIYDHWKKGGLRQLKNFLDFIGTPQDTLNHDLEQDGHGDAVPNRRHYTNRRKLLRKALTGVFGSFEDLQDTGFVTPKQIDKAMATFIDQHMHDMWYFFRWRKDHSHKPANIFRRLLNEMGLKLDKPRSGEHKGRFHLNREALAVMQKYAEIYLKSVSEDHPQDDIAA